MAGAYRGRLVRLSIAEDGEPPDFVTVAGLRNLQVALDSRPVDATTMESAGFRELLPDGGLQSLTVSGEGLMAAGVSIALLQQQALARALRRFRVEFENGDRFEADFAVAALARSGPYDDAEGLSITLESSGPIDFQPGT